MLMLKVLLIALFIAAICGVVIRLFPSLAARAKVLLRHPLARTMLFRAVLRLIRFVIFRRWHLYIQSSFGVNIGLAVKLSPWKTASVALGTGRAVLMFKAAQAWYSKYYSQSKLWNYHKRSTLSLSCDSLVQENRTQCEQSQFRC